MQQAKYALGWPFQRVYSSFSQLNDDSLRLYALVVNKTE